MERKCQHCGSPLPQEKQRDRRARYCSVACWHAQRDAKRATESVIADQPPPVHNPAKADVWEVVIRDMAERRNVGILRYGTPLQPFNGRRSLVDAYQEVLDLAVYLRQKILEEGTAGISATPDLVGTLATHIQFKRQEAKMSLDQLADEAGISKSYLWELEHDTDERKSPSLDVLLRIARALSLKLVDLLPDHMKE